MKNIKYFALFLILFSFFRSSAQSNIVAKKTDTIPGPVIDSSKQIDAIDVTKKLFNKNGPDTRKKASRLNFSLVPAFGYSLSTGFAIDLTGNVAFYTSTSHKENLSAIYAEAIYDTKGQRYAISRSEIWFDHNNYKLVTDLRFERYPNDTYGLGTTTTTATDNAVDFNYVRTYVTIFKKVIPDYYIGLGYNLDYHYNITESGNADKSISDLQKYGFTTHSSSSGLNLNLLFDSRRNLINPLGGGYASLLYRDNFTFLGSNDNWREFQFDFRRYVKLSSQSNNILAFWVVGTFTNGNTPYFDLPATGDDMYGNSGRGYTQYRYRGKDRLYFESEYRFGITSNGLLGGVAFVNAQSFTEFETNRFEKIAPAAGTGLRIKVNKHSDTNVCLDYAVGTGGSRGFFVTLGEVF